MIASLFDEPRTFDFGRGLVPASRHINRNGDKGGWVADTALVEPTAYIGENAVVYGNAQVRDFAKVLDKASVFNDAQVFDNAVVRCGAKVCGSAIVCETAVIDSYAHIYGSVTVTSTPVIISGLLYHVMLTDSHITIAHTQHTPEEWEALSDEEWSQVGRYALMWSKHYLPFLLEITRGMTKPMSREPKGN
jgi:carbonic anhydrase/acetyltransferase-like protein (isoleucine patch superfamily)